MNKKKKKTKSTDWGSKWICLFGFFFGCFFFSSFQDTSVWKVWFLLVSLSELRFLLRCSRTRYSKCLPGLLVYLNSDSCVVEVWTEMDFQSGRWMLPAVFYFYFFLGGGGSEGLGQGLFSFVVQPTGWCLENPPTLRNPRAEFWMSDWDVFLFPEVLLFCFFFFAFRNATKLWVSGVGRLQSSNS